MSTLKKSNPQAKRNSKLTKLGAVWETKNSTSDNPKYCLKLGQENQKDPAYNRTIELVVKDGQGNVLSTHTDPFLTLLDPRQSKFVPQNIPANLTFEVFVGEEH